MVLQLKNSVWNTTFFLYIFEYTSQEFKISADHAITEFEDHWNNDTLCSERHNRNRMLKKIANFKSFKVKIFVIMTQASVFFF